VSFGRGRVAPIGILELLPGNGHRAAFVFGGVGGREVEPGGSVGGVEEEVRDVEGRTGGATAEEDVGFDV